MCCCCTLFVYFILYYAFDPPPSSLIYLFILPLRSSSAPAFLLCLLTSFRIHTHTKMKPLFSDARRVTLLKMPTGLGCICKRIFSFPYFPPIELCWHSDGWVRKTKAGGECVYLARNASGMNPPGRKKIKSGSRSLARLCLLDLWGRFIYY
jgi:hypothetical protein